MKSHDLVMLRFFFLDLLFEVRYYICCFTFLAFPSCSQRNLLNILIQKMNLKIPVAKNLRKIPEVHSK